MSSSAAPDASAATAAAAVAKVPAGDKKRGVDATTDSAAAAAAAAAGEATAEGEAKRRKKMAPNVAKGPGKDAGLREAYVFQPGQFEAPRHYYDRVLNAQRHPLVSSFLGLSVERMATRYCHLHPNTNYEALVGYLKYQPQYFRWAGSDLFTVTDSDARRQMVVVETNSCPSGQKSMPLKSGDDADEMGGYATLLSNTFLPLVCQDFHEDVKDGVLAVIADKNNVEYHGYAAAMAQLTGEPVYVVQCHGKEKQPDPPLRWSDDGQVASVRKADGTWVVVRAAFRYVTQQPWSRLPLVSKTKLLNPVAACLAGGRNKSTAAKAYEIFNAELAAAGLAIRVPETIKDVHKCEVPLWVRSFGGHAVIKNPYSNAGQGVWTITSQAELDDFMEGDEEQYDKYIVQALIGNSSWSSVTRAGQFYHAGTVPNKKNETYVADVRMMVSARPGAGFRPIAIYARRAEMPLVDKLTPESDSWAILGTNLSKKTEDGAWTSETSRLLLMDSKDFNMLGIGVDDLIDGYVQTSLACIAIDKLCQQLMPGGVFNYRLFESLNSDAGLLAELAQAPGAPASLKESTSKK